MEPSSVPSVPFVPSVPCEVEVFRLTPRIDKYYATATYTRKTGTWSQKNERYFTTNPIRYVGKFVEGVTTGMGDGSSHYDIFENNGNTELVHYTYEGTTCFIELPEGFVNLFELGHVDNFAILS
jgi:hypothetical protein